MPDIKNAITKYDNALQSSADRRNQWASISEKIFQILIALQYSYKQILLVKKDQSIQEFPKVLLTINSMHNFHFEDGNELSEEKAVLSFISTYKGEILIDMKYPVIEKLFPEKNQEIKRLQLHDFKDEVVHESFIEFINYLIEWEGYKEAKK